MTLKINSITIKNVSFPISVFQKKKKKELIDNLYINSI